MREVRDLTGSYWNTRSIPLLLLLAACTEAPKAPSEIPRWPIPTQPTIRIGPDVPTGHEFAGIVSARKLADGTILVANSGALELALFDSTGKFLRSIGRKGNGPGEFAATVNLFAASDDSLAVYDGGNLRWSIFSPALTLSRTFTTSDPGSPHPTWVYRGALITQAALHPAPSWIFPILDTLRAADPEVTHLIEGRVDDLGAVWIRGVDSSGSWRVYAGPGQAVGTATLPPGVQVLQIGRDFVLGVVADSMGLETVALFHLQRPALVTSVSVDAAPAGEPPHPALPPDPTLRAEFARAVLTAQEGYYSDHGSYTGQADSLKYSIDPPARLFLLYGDKRHWAGIMVRLKTYATCGVSVGAPAPAGWDDGTALCDR